MPGRPGSGCRVQTQGGTAGPVMTAMTNGTQSTRPMPSLPKKTLETDLSFLTIRTRLTGNSKSDACGKQRIAGMGRIGGTALPEYTGGIA